MRKNDSPQQLASSWACGESLARRKRARESLF
jgi:hypothetical protein